MTTILDETLFGVRDFGKMTLVQLKTLHDQMYERQEQMVGRSALHSIAEWLKNSTFRYLWLCSTDFYPDAPASVKYKQMVKYQDFPEHEYRVKFDIRQLTTTDVPNTYKRADVFAIYIWIDDILMSTYIPKYIEFDTIFTLNAAHKPYLHDLYYAEFRTNMARITEELVAAAMHPRRLTRYLELGGEIDDW